MPEKNALRDQIIGLGAQSLRKSYYPQLQQQIEKLEKAKASLQESERKFRALFEKITDGVIAFNQETLDIAMVNPAFCQMLGYTEAELLRLTPAGIHPPAETPGVLDKIASLIRGTPSYLFKDLPFLRKDGSIVFAEVNTSHIDIDGQHCLLGVCRDITERKKAEEQIKERDEWMRYIIQHDPNAIAVFDRDLKYIFVSDRFLHDYRLQACDIIGKHHYEVIGNIPDHWKDVHRRCLAGAVERSDRDSFELHDGSAVYVRWECRPWYLGNGQIGGIILYTEVITERILAEQKLQRSEADLGRAQALAHVGNWSYDIAKDRLQWSDELFRIFRIRPDAFDGTQTSFFRLVHPEDLWKHQRALQDVMEGKAPEPYDIRIVRPDGTERVIDVRGIEIETGPDGQPARVFGVAQDITEQRTAENALNREQEFNRALVESMVDAVVACDVNARLTLFNRAAREMHGLSLENIPPAQWARYYHLYQADGVTPQPLSENALMRSYRGEVVHNTAMTIRPPELPLRHILVNSAPFFDANGRMLGAVAVLHDITQRKNAEEALVASEQKYRELVENANSIILRWTPEGTISYMNEYGLTFFGYTEEEIVGRRVAGTIVPEFETSGRSLFPLIHDVQADPVRYQHNINENIRRNGERAWIAWTNKVVRDPAGRIKEILSIGSNVTERMRAEEALKQAKEDAEAANRAKDQFIAVLSHELRTPLTPVLSTISYLKLRDELPEDFRDDLDMIRRNVELEARLIDDLLDVTRISRGILELHRENVNAHALLLKALEICRSEIAGKGMKIALSLEAENFHVRGDSARLQQVFWNLLKNAIKFTPAEGRISIRSFNRGSRLRMEFADNGIGISPEILPKIFNAFEQGEKTWTRRFGGLGLGLSISKAIVDLHEGKLAAFSEGLNKGTVFTLELETVPPALQETLPPPVRAARSTAQRKILLVEDHADTLQILSRLLERWSYKVQAAESVAKALELAAKEHFDLLISDIGLPDGSGLEVMRQMRGRYGTRGIALSGFGTEEDRKQSQEAGFELHLIKPVGVESLHAGVEQILS